MVGFVKNITQPGQVLKTKRKSTDINRDGQTDRQASRETDRQTDDGGTHTHTHKHGKSEKLKTEGTQGTKRNSKIK